MEIKVSGWKLLYFHIDLLRLGFLSLGEYDGQHPLIAIRLDIFPVDGQRERETSLK